MGPSITVPLDSARSAACPHSPETERRYNVASARVRDQLLGALVVASCRPERRYSAADLRLLEEVGRRAALALENARLYRIAERAIEARDDMLGIVAHDLRNPLDTIRMQATLLQRGGDEQGRIERAAIRINRLIDDLLDMTRMEAGRLTIDGLLRSTSRPSRASFAKRINSRSRVSVLRALAHGLVGGAGPSVMLSGTTRSARTRDDTDLRHP